MVGAKLLFVTQLAQFIQANILRLPGQLYITQGDSIQNVYTYKLINKTNNDYDDLKIKLISHPGNIKVVEGIINLEKSKLHEGTLFIKIAKKDINLSKERLNIGIYYNGELIETNKTNFPAPLQVK